MATTVNYNETTVTVYNTTFSTVASNASTASLPVEHRLWENKHLCAEKWCFGRGFCEKLKGKILCRCYRPFIGTRCVNIHQVDWVADDEEKPEGVQNSLAIWLTVAFVVLVAAIAVGFVVWRKYSKSPKWKRWQSTKNDLKIAIEGSSEPGRNGTTENYNVNSQENVVNQENRKTTNETKMTTIDERSCGKLGADLSLDGGRSYLNGALEM